MAKYPEPPKDPGKLAARCAAEELILPAGAYLFRVYFRGGDYPTSWNVFRYYGPTESRFDHHAGPPPHLQDRGILYAAEDVHVCLAEVFQDQSTRNIDRYHRDPWLVGFALAREVRLLNLCDAWPTRAGASQAIISGQKARARRWSRRIYEDYPTIEGLCHRSSLDGSRRCVTLYERALNALPSAPSLHRALKDPALDSIVAGTAVKYRYTVHPD